MKKLCELRGELIAKMADFLLGRISDSSPFEKDENSENSNIKELELINNFEY